MILPIICVHIADVTSGPSDNPTDVSTGSPTGQDEDTNIG